MKVAKLIFKGMKVKENAYKFVNSSKVCTKGKTIQIQNREPDENAKTKKKTKKHLNCDMQFKLVLLKFV